MAVARDWVGDLARDLAEHLSSEGEVRDAILKHCPFKPDTAYAEVAEPPLLQCVSCKNTESPAGAVARHFNCGRCLHCGGTFVVVRA